MHQEPGLEKTVVSFSVAGWPDKLWVSPGTSYCGGVFGLSIGAQWSGQSGPYGGGVMAIEEVKRLRDFLSEWLYDCERRQHG
jgi:hypothetical protein